MTEKQRERALMAYLAASARLGDRRAAGQLVALAAPRLAAHARRLLGEAEAARDVLQAAWEDIFRGLPALRDDRLFLAWALSIVSRRVSREIGRRQKERRLAADWAAEAEESVEALTGTADEAAVRKALGALSPEQRATVALFYLEDMSVAEVAAATDVPPGTVKTRLMHARDKLRALLEGGESHDKA